MKSVSFWNWNHSSPRAQRTIFFYLIPSQFLSLSSMCVQKRWLLTFSLHWLCSSTSHLFTSRLRLVYWSTLQNSKWLSYFYILLCIITHLLLFLSPDWLIFCHMIMSRINSHGFLFIFCFSLTKGQRSKR